MSNANEEALAERKPKSAERGREVLPESLPARLAGLCATAAAMAAMAFAERMTIVADRLDNHTTSFTQAHNSVYSIPPHTIITCDLLENSQDYIHSVIDHTPRPRRNPTTRPRGRARLSESD